MKGEIECTKAKEQASKEKECSRTKERATERNDIKDKEKVKE